MKITVDGIEIELTNEQLKEIEKKKRARENPFCRVPYKEEYYIIDNMYNLCKIVDVNDDTDESYHNNANYCCNKELIQQRAYWIKLSQLLWRDSGIKNTKILKTRMCVYDIKYDSIYRDWIVEEVPDNIYGSSPVYYCIDDAEDAIKSIIKPFCEKHNNFIPDYNLKGVNR